MTEKVPTIYERVILVQFIAIILIMGINGVITYRINWKRSVEQMDRDIQQVSGRLSKQLSLPFWNLDENAVKSLLLQEIKNPYLTGIEVRQDGKLWTGVTINRESEITVVSAKENETSVSFIGKENPKVRVSHIDNRGKNWELGDLVVYTTDEPIKKIFSKLFFQSVVQTIVLIVGLNSITIILLNMFLNKPLRQITQTACRIGNGEIELQAEVAGTREVVTLATAFNNMTSRLRESVAELDNYFTCSLDLLCIFDINGVFRRANKEWESAIGYPVSELIGRNFMEFVYKEDVDRTVIALQNLLQNKEVFNFVNRYTHKDGSYRWIEWRSSSTDDAIYSAARDITERVENEKKIQRMNEELEQRVAERTERLAMINKELESFSYSVSHDLRAPLRHINGFISLLQSECESELNDKGKHYLQVISGASEKMGLLIDQLLQLSRTGRKELKKTNVNMNKLVADVINELNVETSDRTVSWTIDDMPDTSADASMLQAVLTNIISNALKFTRTRENAEIHIGSLPGEKKSETVYFVKDNGVGFDMKYHDKLFGVFQRLHSSDDFEGTGIGLANVQRIINKHGGKTWAEGEIDKGASFYFSLVSG